MTDIEAQLIAPLKKLPPSRVAEVVDFVEFLSQHKQRAAAHARAGQARCLGPAGCLWGEVETEIQPALQERRAQQDG